MAAGAPQIDDTVARLEALVRRLEERLAAVERPAGPELLTKRAAARALGCDRATTLEQLIRSGRLRAVPAPSGKGLRIPRSEVERAKREGLRQAPARAASPAPPRVRPRGSARARPAAADVAAAIRSLPVDE